MLRKVQRMQVAVNARAPARIISRRVSIVGINVRFLDVTYPFLQESAPDVDRLDGGGAGVARRQWWASLAFAMALKLRRS